MGFLSATVSLSRYHIQGKFEAEPMESVRSALIDNAMPIMDSEYQEISAGWTPYESPFQPDFEKYPFIFGTCFLFSLRMDKKSIPAKLLQKHLILEIEKKKESSGRDFLSKNEKSEIKETVTDMLMLKMPAIPDIFDILWRYEDQNLFLFTTRKAVTEFFESFFFKSFSLKPIRLFPYTLMEHTSGFTPDKKDRIMALTPLYERT
jgi:recombination associated protein RdgC